MAGATTRLNRYLASCGVGSRRQCDRFIEDGRVAINGRIVTQLATQVGEDDQVTFEGKLVEPEEITTIVFHKPTNCLCTRDDPQERTTIYDVLPGRFRKLHHVGRLDRNSDGLLILTNSGELSQKLTHPKHKIEKEYLVSLDHAFDPDQWSRLIEGIETPEGFASAVSATIISPRRLRVVLRQGLKRQIRLMFEALGYRVKSLSRIRIGKLTIDDLRPGKFRVLNAEEIAQLAEHTRTRAVPPKKRVFERRKRTPRKRVSRGRRMPPAKKRSRR